MAQPSFGLTVTEKMDMKPLIQQIQWNKQPLPSDMLPLTSEPKLYFQPKNISLSLSLFHTFQTSAPRMTRNAYSEHPQPNI